MTGYLGPCGTFSHIAAEKFCREEDLREFATIYAAIMAVWHDEIDSCIVPIENSIEGSVNTTLDTLALETGLYITGEYILKIHQNLIVKPGTKKENIQIIASHPQAIGQCAKLLNRDFKSAKIVFTDSTAKAAQSVIAGDGSTATIASKSCAELNSLEILIPDCGDDLNNATRFVRLEKERSKSENDKTSIAFTLENRSGTLYHALSIFDEFNINMIKIESRPLKTGLGQYIFFIDIDGDADEENIGSALEKLKTITKSLRMLGSYRKFSE